MGDSMQTKKVFSSELAYLFGILILALGTAFMEKADFGMSMVVAPAYLIHLKISQTYWLCLRKGIELSKSVLY
jgi:uncharacterized membrane protein YczE